MPTLEEIDWLQSPEGAEICREMAVEHPADTPAAIERWRKRVSAEHVAAAWAQVVYRRKAGAKFSRADRMLFDRVGLEQATDEVTAAYKARRFAGRGRIADLCCGIGGDTLALAAVGPVVALDTSSVRCAMARHNAAVYGHEIAVMTGFAGAEHPEADAIHVDPDRRAGGGRAHEPAFASPGPDVLVNLVGRYRHAAIKFSPGADLSELGLEGEIEFISLHGDCKQAVLWTGDLATTGRRATMLPGGETLCAAGGEAASWPEPAPIKAGDVVFEPDPALIRADLVGLLAARLELRPVDSEIAWLVGSGPVSSAWLRGFGVLSVIEWSMSKARPWLVAHGIGSLEIKTRGFAGRPEDIARRLRLTGPRSAVLMLTRLAGRPTAILAERMDAKNNPETGEKPGSSNAGCPTRPSPG